jgi:POTRA domain, ShlB-type
LSESLLVVAPSGCSIQKSFANIYSLCYGTRQSIKNNVVAIHSFKACFLFKLIFMAQNDQPSTPPRLTILTTDHYKGKLMTNNVLRKCGLNPLNHSEMTGLNPNSSLQKILVIVFMCIFVEAFAAFAEHSGFDPTGRSGDSPRQFELADPVPPLEFTLPPLDTPSENEQVSTMSSLRIMGSEIEITGNTVFSRSDLAQIALPYLNRQLAAEDIEALRRALTVHYVERGYINSGTIIPDQTLADGRIIIQIIEGELTRIQVQTSGRFRPGYVENRLWLDGGPPLNIVDL